MNTNHRYKLLKRWMLNFFFSFSVSKEDHGSSASFICVLLSHGDEDVFYGTDGALKLKDLTSLFRGDRCKSLVGKPKLFFIQVFSTDCFLFHTNFLLGLLVYFLQIVSVCNHFLFCLCAHCEGLQRHWTGCRHWGRQFRRRHQDPCGSWLPLCLFHSSRYTLQHTCYCIWIVTFFYIALIYLVQCSHPSTGYYSWRNTQTGSWFIQSLCEMITTYGKDLELMHIMTRVNHKVAVEFESVSNSSLFHAKKQIPCIVSMLTKEMYFSPWCHLYVRRPQVGMPSSAGEKLNNVWGCLVWGSY